MKKITYLRLRAFILRRLVDERCFRQKQMLAENVAEFAKENRKQAVQAINKLIAEGPLCVKTKHYDKHVWINLDRLEEIKQIIASD